MGKKVVLINPRKGWRPALGLLYIASYLKEAGYKVKIMEIYLQEAVWDRVLALLLD